TPLNRRKDGRAANWSAERVGAVTGVTGVTTGSLISPIKTHTRIHTCPRTGDSGDSGDSVEMIGGFGVTSVSLKLVTLVTGGDIAILSYPRPVVADAPNRERGGSRKPG